MSGVFDLTYRCNFRCVHCYVGHMVGQSLAQAKELTTAEIIEIFSEAAEAGCLFALLSGGEPLLRPDFLQVYEAAKRSGMIVSLFTNASLIGDRHMEVFAELPPHQVEVTLYGATEGVYEKVTGTAGSFGRVRRGIERLLDLGITVGLKSVILRDNEHEIAAMEAFAQSLGVHYRVDPLITPRLDGDRAPLVHRVDAERAVEIEMATGSHRQRMIEFLDRHEATVDKAAVPSRKSYRCGAGVANFHVDPWGYMHPCIMGRSISHSALALGFEQAWQSVKEAVDRATWDIAGRCGDCADIILCGYCAGVLELEQASPSEPPEYLCRLGSARRTAVGRVA